MASSLREAVAYAVARHGSMEVRPSAGTRAVHPGMFCKNLGTQALAGACHHLLRTELIVAARPEP